MDPNSHTLFRRGRRPGQQGPRTQLDTGRRDMWRQRIRVADPSPGGGLIQAGRKRRR